MATNYIEEGCTLQWTNATGGNVASNDVIAFGTKQLGIALVDIADTETGSVGLEGVYQLAKTTGAISQGHAVFWDSTNEYCINAPALNSWFIGFAAEAATNGATTVNVSLKAFSYESNRVITLAATGNQTITAADFMCGNLTLLAPNTAAKTVSLPAVASIPVGATLTVRKTTADAFAITLDPNSSEQIAGGSTYASIDANNDYAVFMNSGSAWLLIFSSIA